MSPRLSAIVSTDGIHRNNGEGVLALFGALALPWERLVCGTTETAGASVEWTCYDCSEPLSTSLRIPTGKVSWVLPKAFACG